MNYIYYILGVLIVTLTYVFITKIFMIVAAFVGERLGFGKFFMYLWEKVRG